jgi:hypothetical protein
LQTSSRVIISGKSRSLWWVSTISFFPYSCLDPWTRFREKLFDSWSESFPLRYFLFDARKASTSL